MTDAPVPAQPEITDADIEALLTPSEAITVVLAVPNGLVQDGQVVLVPTVYRTTLSAVMAAQATLADGVVVDINDAVRRATDRINGIVKDPALAEQIAAHLAEGGLLATGM
ncbi:hypothetical protein N866_03255 [Actinotalea ferrariae CF5-4]|uniref:Uncharacterized protein n=1 Tax=Actinotalea ferrariae CF5-4 TaxID=948458 RepID=A0A021VUN0_9CELL|nr:hypothetical protein [Actinotalea ferrariae]EYR64874.1 hypothetical protein N866_03255 [Actinotalea ferrariae CF5-4]